MGAPEQHDNEEAASDDEEAASDDEEAASDDEDGTDTPEETPPNPEEPRATREQLETLHAKADADRNGKLSVDEVLQFLHEIRKSISVRTGKELFAGLDADNDGKVSLDELMKEMYGGYVDEIEDEKEKEK